MQDEELYECSRRLSRRELLALGSDARPERDSEHRPVDLAAARVRERRARAARSRRRGRVQPRRPLALPARRTTAFSKCAGNGRSFFASQQGTPAAGSAWRLGAIGVARWKGVPLAELPERAGVRHGAVDVMPQGLDAPVVSDGVDHDHVRRPLPVGKALDDVLLAYEMNGEQLPPDHGFPVRLVVPGWIGIASVKWVGQIEVSETPLFSPWNTKWYRFTGPSYPPDSPPLVEQPVKSAFELPWGARLVAGRRQHLHGRS